MNLNLGVSSCAEMDNKESNKNINEEIFLIINYKFQN